MDKKEIFVIGTWLNNKARIETLIENIELIQAENIPVCLVSHYPDIPSSIYNKCNYFIFDKENVLSHDWSVTHWRVKNGVREEKLSTIQYHAVACLMNVKNALGFLKAQDKYDYMFYSEGDLEFDIKLFLDNCRKSNKRLNFFDYYGDSEGYRSDIFSGEVSYLHKAFPRITSWDTYFKIGLEINSDHLLENWLRKYFQKHDIVRHINILPDQEILNLYDQVERDIWGDGLNPLPPLPTSKRKKIIKEEKLEAKSQMVDNGSDVTSIDFSDAPDVLMKGTKRTSSFCMALEELHKKESKVIVEVGVSRSPGSLSDGDSTSIWGWYINKYGGSYYGCDINPKNVDTCEKILQSVIKLDGKSYDVTVTESDGMDFLKNFAIPIDLIYLDGIDWEAGSIRSELMHIEWLLTVIPKLKVGGCVLIDDTFDVETFRGKGGIVIPYLLGIGNFTCLHKGYQFLFRKEK